MHSYKLITMNRGENTMKFDISFEVTSKCTVYDVDHPDSPMTVDHEVKLNLFKSDAENFLFRFAPARFNVDTYSVMMKSDQYSQLKGIVLLRKDFGKNLMYVINTPASFLAQVFQGYNRIQISEKMCSILEYDFHTSLEDSDGIVDEFDLGLNE